MGVEAEGCVENGTLGDRLLIRNVLRRKTMRRMRRAPRSTHSAPQLATVNMSS